MGGNVPFGFRVLALSVIALPALTCEIHAQQNVFPPTGNVGIGTTTPGAKLSVAGANATPNIETTEVVRLLRPGVTGVKNTNSVGLRVGAFEPGISGRTRQAVFYAPSGIE